MAYDSFEPIQPPATGDLRVLGIARISTKNQDEMSLSDQEDLHKEFVRDNFEGDFTYDSVATQAKGEWLDRDELEQIRTAINTRKYHVVVMEDLGRLLRGIEAINFCKIAVDQGVRLIAINDGVDTARDDWEERAATASIRHARYVEETSRRIKQRKRARFIREGRALACEVFGYIKTPGAQTENDLVRDPAAEPIYETIFSLLEGGASYAEVSDWLNDHQVPVGPFCRGVRWTGKMLARLVHNPILKGLRVRNRLISRKHHGSGKRKSVKAKPEELRTRNCPHLAFIESDRYDRLVHMLHIRNENCGRKRRDGVDPLLNRPKKRTTWPGQHLGCSVCNRMYTFGGHGQLGRLTCAGVPSYTCWNTFSVDACEAGRRIYTAVFEAIQKLPQFDDAFRQVVETRLRAASEGQAGRIRELQLQKETIEREEQNLLAQIREYGASRLLNDEIKRLDRAKVTLLYQIQNAQAANALPTHLPSTEMLKTMALDAIGDLAPNSAEFLRCMQRLIPQIWLYPFRLLDGGHIVLRAQFVLNLSPLMKGIADVPDIRETLSQLVTVDLYNVPDREKYRVRVVDAMNRLKNQRHVATELGIAQAVVSRSLKLQKLMDEHGASDPYALVMAPPADYGKLRVHRHKRYKFTPDTRRSPAPPFVP